MTDEKSTAILSAIESAGIEKFALGTDLMTTLYHDGKNYINKFVDGTWYNFRNEKINKGSTPPFTGNLGVVAVDSVDVHEIRVAGDYEHIKAFAEALNIELSDDELKLLIQIDKQKNAEIVPETGDYVHGFKYLGEKELSWMTPEEREQYEADKEAYEEAKKNYIGQNMAASITLGR